MLLRLRYFWRNLGVEALRLTDYERDCAGFKVILSVVVQRDLKVRFVWICASRLILMPANLDMKAKDRTRSGPEGRIVTPGETGQVVFFGPPTAPNSFKRALDALLDFMKLISYDQTVSCLKQSLNI